MKIKCIKAEIFGCKFGDCSNDGITNRFTDVYIPHDEGCYTIDTDEAPENLVILETKNFFGKNYIRFVPYHIMNSGKLYMMGGKFAYSCDSRFRDLSDYPIPIHDRVE